jgi:hypothetical protein
VIERESASTDEDEQLDWYLDSILQDMDDLVHRMLSMAYVVAKPDGAAISSYMTDELLNSTSGLKDACEKFCIDTMCVPNKPEERVHEFALLDFCHKFLSSPFDFENKLTLVITKKMEEDYRDEVEREKKRVWDDRKRAIAQFKQWEKMQKEMKKYEEEEEEEEEGNKWKKFLFNDGGPEYQDQDQDQDLDQDLDQDQDQDQENLDLDPDTREYLVERMKVERKFFMDDRDGWNSTWGSKSVRCGDFKDKSKKTCYLNCLISLLVLKF